MTRWSWLTFSTGVSSILSALFVAATREMLEPLPLLLRRWPCPLPPLLWWLRWHRRKNQNPPLRPLHHPRLHSQPTTTRYRQRETRPNKSHRKEKETRGWVLIDLISDFFKILELMEGVGWNVLSLPRYYPWIETSRLIDELMETPGESIITLISRLACGSPVLRKL